MTLKFEPIEIKKQNDYLKQYRRSGVSSSDYTFINLWGWSEEYQLEWAWSDHLTWIRQNHPIVRYWAPVGDWQRTDWKKEFERFPSDATQFIRVPEKLYHIWQQALPASVRIEETKGQWDYLYDFKELIELKGNRFHKKKNLVNQFKKNYDYRYLPYSPEMMMRARELQTDWCIWRDCEANETLAMENRVIERVLSNGSELMQMTGGALVVGDELICYTIAEAVFSNDLVIHFEKGNPEFKGSYQAINQLFLEHNDQYDYVHVNREQDIDDPGLRKAKLSYNPVGFIKKDNVFLG